MDHVQRNREAWTHMSRNYVEPGREACEEIWRARKKEAPATAR